ncbi:MAG: hypothetical protein ACD_7C00126G0014 [uncultured bacterium]|nr:MAG: hypothetical protein ACD_7C00126G0014 [uncultured bacterium]HBR79156.1 hypothetical protein [Candidatus Moranbacteria bacterium]
MNRETLQEMGKRYPKVGPMLNITFKKDGIEALREFLNLGRRTGFVIFENPVIVLAVIESGRWEHDYNRVVRASFPMGYVWQDEIFLQRVAVGIESIRFTTAHPLNVLMTGRHKVQQENFVRILHECYGDLNYEGILPDFQLQLMGDLEIVHGFPQITFTLDSIPGHQTVIILDGWSGQIIIDGVPQQKAYSDPKEFHEIVRNLAYKYVDKITAPAQ